MVAAAVADLAPLQWLLLIIAAFLAGLSKTALNGIGPFTAAVAALVLPVAQSTGFVLLLLLAGDLVAITVYRAHADWRVIRKLAPAIVVGILLGVALMSNIDAQLLRRVLGTVLLLLVVLQFIQNRKPALFEDVELPRWITNAAGTTAGFTSMLANAGGPVMNLYLLNVKSAVLGFLGTTAWVFFAINIMKLPFSIGLGLLNGDMLLTALVCLPALYLGAWMGLRIARRISLETFKRLILLFTAVAAVNLIW